MAKELSGADSAQIAGRISVAEVEISYLCPIFSDESTPESKAVDCSAPTASTVGLAETTGSKES